MLFLTAPSQIYIIQGQVIQGFMNPVMVVVLDELSRRPPVIQILESATLESGF